MANTNTNTTSSISTSVSGRSGVPSFATPWVELGKLEEREKWQALAIDLVETSIASEFEDLKRGVSEALPASRLVELKSKINEKVDDAQQKISNLIAEYRKLISMETPHVEKQAMIHALQYQAYGFDERIPDMTEEVTTTINEEIVIEDSTLSRRS